MTSPLATNAERTTDISRQRFLEVNENNQPLDGQVPRTYQEYTGDGGEVVVLDGSDQFICTTDVPAGVLVLTVGGQTGIRNLLGRIIRLTFPVGIANDVELDVAPGMLTVTQNGVPSTGYTFTGPMTPFDVELQFYEDLTVFVALRCVAGGGPVTVGDIVGGTDGQVIRFIGTTATAVDEVLLDNVPAGANGQVLTTTGGNVTWATPTGTLPPTQANEALVTTHAGVVQWTSPPTQLEGVLIKSTSTGSQGPQFITGNYAQALMVESSGRVSFFLPPRQLITSNFRNYSQNQFPAQLAVAGENVLMPNNFGDVIPYNVNGQIGPLAPTFATLYELDFKCQLRDLNNGDAITLNLEYANAGTGIGTVLDNYVQNVTMVLAGAMSDTVSMRANVLPDPNTVVRVRIASVTGTVNIHNADLHISVHRPDTSAIP